MVYNIRDLQNILKNWLNESRYEHSLGVMQTMIALAKHYGADIEKAQIAGLLHDITKNCGGEKHLYFIAQYNIPVTEAEKKNTHLLHAITAPYILKNELHIEDEAILSAIRYHTTARAHMPLLEKLLYIADFIEPTRHYSDVAFYRKIAFEDLDKTVFVGLKWNLEDLLRKQRYIHPDAIKAYNDYTLNDNFKYIEIKKEITE